MLACFNRICPLVFLVCLHFFSLSGVNLFAQQTEEISNDDPVKLFNLGQDAQEKGELRKAIQFYEKALDIFAEFPEAEYQRAVAFLALNDLDKAEQGFRKAIELRQDWTLPRTMLGLVLFRKNNLDEAEKVLKKTIELDEQNPVAYSTLAQIRIKKIVEGQETPESLKELYPKIKNFSEKGNANLWAIRGSIERFLNDKESAKNSLNRALQIDSMNALAISELAEIFILEGNVEQAKFQLENLKRILPDALETKLLAARVYALQGEVNKALEIIDSLPDSNPNVKAIKEKIELQRSSDVTTLENQLKKDPENKIVLSRLCYLTRLSSPAKSVQYCQKLLLMEPENLDYAVAYGAALVQAKKFEEAVDVLQKVLNRSPENYVARANLATSFFQLKRYREAKREYLWLVSKKPESAVAYYFLAVTQDNLGEYLDAIFSYQRFLQLADPEKHKLEIEAVNFRLPVLQRRIKDSKK